MSDGPHRSLPMRPGWKRLAQRADNANFTPAQVHEALLPALSEDCRIEMTTAFLDAFKGVYGTLLKHGAAADFPAERITGKLRQYAIAGTLHLDHLAGLRSSAANAAPLNLSAHQLGNALGMSQQEARTKLDRLLRQHEIEWKAFVKSLGRSSFITDWALHAS